MRDDVDLITAEQVRKLLETLAFYGNPETYFAVGFLSDPPCGEIMDDFEATHLGFKPGRRARELLLELTDIASIDDSD